MLATGAQAGQVCIRVYMRAHTKKGTNLTEKLQHGCTILRSQAEKLLGGLTIRAGKCEQGQPMVGEHPGHTATPPGIGLPLPPPPLHSLMQNVHQ